MDNYNFNNQNGYQPNNQNQYGYGQPNQQQYGNQLEIYKAVLQHLTGKPVKEAMLLSI